MSNGVPQIHTISRLLKLDVFILLDILKDVPQTGQDISIVIETESYMKNGFKSEYKLYSVSYDLWVFMLFTIACIFCFVFPEIPIFIVLIFII